MFALGLLPFHPARSPASGEFFISPAIPALALSSCKSNYSRTSAIPRGGGIYRFPCQTSSPRSFQRNPALCPLSFQSLTHSFIFRSTSISCAPNAFRTLSPKQGGTPAGHTNSPRPIASVPLPHLLPFPPFTAHSQSCHRPFTHPSPSLVRMNPSQGSNSYTMPIAIPMPTVHFYRCDPLREMPS